MRTIRGDLPMAVLRVEEPQRIGRGGIVQKARRKRFSARHRRVSKVALAQPIFPPIAEYR